MQQNRVTRFIQAGLFFLVAIMPLVFSPFAAELLDLAKVTIFIIVPALLLFLFFFQNRKNAKLNFSWTFLDQAVVMFGIMFALATLFSKNTWYSLIGFDIYYGYTFAALMGGILLYFFLRFQEHRGEQHEQTSWLMLLLGGSMAAVLELVARFTDILPSQLTQIISPSVVHSSLFVLFLLFIGENQLRQQQKTGAQLLVGCCILINTIYLLLTATGSTWVVLILLTALFILIVRRNPVQQARLLPLWIVLIFGLSVLLLPLAPGSGEPPLTLAHSTKLDLAWQTIAHHPLFGVGPNNFLFAFDHYRAIQFNQEPQGLLTFATGTDLWLELLLTTGVLGFVAWVFLLIRLLPFRPWQSTNLGGPLLCVVVAASIFSSFTVLHWFLFWICLAAIVNQQLRQHTPVPVKQYIAPQLLQLLTISTALFLLLTGSVFGKIWLAESYHFQAGTVIRQTGAWEKAEQFLQKAVAMNPRNISYQLDLASHWAYGVRFMATEKEITTTPPEVEEALEILNATLADPNRNTLTFQKIAETAEILRPLSPGAENFLEKLYEKWREDQPNNPIPPYLLAIFYLRQRDEAQADAANQSIDDDTLLEKAQSNLKKSIKLKPDYQPAQDLLLTIEKL